MMKRKKILSYNKRKKQFILYIIVLGLLTFQVLPLSNINLTSISCLNLTPGLGELLF